MANIEHPILGSIDPSVPGFWDATVTFDGRDVEFDLTVDGSGLTPADIGSLPRRVEDLAPLDHAARLAILEDARSGDDDSAATLYLTHHHDALPGADFARLFGTDTPDLAEPDALLSRLVLIRVGLYPENEDRPFLLDYSIDPDATNYLLSVSFDSNRQPFAVDLES